MSRDKLKTLYLHFHITCKYQTWHSGDLGVPTYKVTCLLFQAYLMSHALTYHVTYLQFHNTYKY